MAKITINSVSYTYIEYYQPVFKNLKLILDSNWKLGLIGRNGRGKTTFLKILKGELVPDSGNISTDVHMEYFPYDIDHRYSKTLDIIKENAAGLKKIEETMDSIMAAHDETRMEEYTSLMNKYIELDGFSMDGRIKKELYYMHLPEDILERNFDMLSGGEKTKILIIILFLRKNAFVLLDEPTNHLDIEGKHILIEYLKRKKGFIAASHDRDFLNCIVDHILSINKYTIELVKGNYNSWRENKDKEELFEYRTGEKLKREIRQLEKMAEQSRKWSEIGNKQKYTFRSQARGNGTKAQMAQAKRAEETIKANLHKKTQLLKDLELTDKLEIVQSETKENALIEIKNVDFCYDQRYILQNIHFSICKGDRIWIFGKNGSGKSTLMKLLSAELKPLCGAIERTEGIKISYVSQYPLWTTGNLYELAVNEDILTSILELCAHFDLEAETLDRPLETLSNGELRKLDIARALVMNNQLILMDEPLNYMDIYFREQLESAIMANQPTIVFIEHDEMFGKRVATKTIQL